MIGAELRRTWFGPICVIIGVATLSAQAHLWMSVHVLSARLIGGGIAALFIGIVACFYEWEERRIGARSMQEEFPTPDEFDRDFRLIDRDEPPQSE
jgi:hypothetical protein